ncbi:hypothetical protein HEP_00283700 [Hepatocystis sp. ex Piliocolobus tephrosceles]|nr:hypothetical protein HEP_00283700 [Hepatocystis sp. ex Piliocolobus tephrosceles]
MYHNFYVFINYILGIETGPTIGLENVGATTDMGNGGTNDMDNGGTNDMDNGGTNDMDNGGTNDMDNGGTTDMGNGVTTDMGNGVTTDMGNGVTTDMGNGVTTDMSNGGTTDLDNGGTNDMDNGGTTDMGNGGTTDMGNGATTSTSGKDVKCNRIKQQNPNKKTNTNVTSCYMFEDIKNYNYFKNILKKKDEKVIILLNHNIYSTILLKTLLQHNNVILLNIEHIKNNQQIKENSIILVDIKNNTDIFYMLEEFINNNIAKIYLFFYINVNNITDNILKKGTILNFDFSYDSKEYFTFLQFILNLNIIINKKYINIFEQNIIYYKQIFFAMFFYVLLNEQKQSENISFNYDIINELFILFEVFGNLNMVKDIQNNKKEDKKSELQKITKTNLVDNEKKCKDFFLQYIQKLIESTHNDNFMLQKHMLLSFLSQFFNFKTSKNLLSDINHILQIPTTNVTINHLIRHIQTNFKLVYNIQQPNKITQLFKNAYQIKILNKCFINKQLIINKYEKLNIFKIILLFFYEFSSFRFIKPFVNATAKLNYLTNEYNNFLCSVKEIKKDIYFFLKAAYYGKPLNKNHLQMEHILLLFKIPPKWKHLSSGENNLISFFTKIKKKLNYLQSIIKKEQKGEDCIYNLAMFKNPLLFLYSYYFTYANNMNTDINNLSISFKYSETVDNNEEGLWLDKIKIYKSNFINSQKRIQHKYIHKKNEIYFNISNEEKKINEVEDLSCENKNSSNDNFGKTVNNENDGDVKKEINLRTCTKTDVDINKNLNKKKNIFNKNSYKNFIKKKEKNFYYDTPYILIKIKKNKKVENAHYNKNIEKNTEVKDYSENGQNINETMFNTQQQCNYFFDVFTNNDNTDNTNSVYYCPIMKYNSNTKKNNKLLFFLPLPCAYNKLIYKKLKVHMLL